MTTVEADEKKPSMTKAQIRPFAYGMLLCVIGFRVIDLFTPIGQRAFAQRHSETELHAARSNASTAATTDYDVVIVGGSASGLSMGARLKVGKVSYVILEKETPGSSWTKRYDRLHLHTITSISQLPYWPMPSTTPMYASKDDVATYQHAYSLFLNVHSNTAVTSARFNNSTKIWTVQALGPNGNMTYTAKTLVVCTGQESDRRIINIKGQETFPGPIIHSADYRNGKGLENKRALVVGFGNSGAEMALDLWEWGAKVTALVRSPVNIVPRYMATVYNMLYPVLHALPPSQLDASQPLLYSLFWGDLPKYNITLSQRGTIESVYKYHRSPVIDLGTIDLIRKVEIDVINHEIESIVESKVCHGGLGRHGPHAKFLSPTISSKLINEYGVIDSGVEGRLAEINLEAAAIAADIVTKGYVS